MILEIKSCSKCGSTALVNNGRNGVGNPRYKCKDCQFSGVIKSRRADESTKELVVKASQERSSLRGLSRTFGIGRQTASNWIKKSPVASWHRPHASSREENGRFGIGWVVVIRLLQTGKKVGLDSIMPPNKANRIVLHWRPKREKLQSFLAACPQEIPSMLVFQRLLGRLLKSDWYGQTLYVRQTKRWNQPRRTVEQHLETAHLTVCP